MTDTPKETNVKRERRKSISLPQFRRKASQKQKERAPDNDMFEDTPVDKMEDYKLIPIAPLLNMDDEKALNLVRKIDAKNKEYLKYMNERVSSMRAKTVKMKQLRRKLESQDILPEEPPNHEAQYIEMRDRHSKEDVIDTVIGLHYLMMNGVQVIPYIFNDDVDRKDHRLTDDNVVEPHQIAAKAKEIATAKGEKLVDEVRKQQPNIVAHTQTFGSQLTIKPQGTKRRSKQLYPEVGTVATRSTWDK